MITQTKWDIYRCEEESCLRGFAIEQVEGNELEEPACPECGGTLCVSIID